MTDQTYGANKRNLDSNGVGLGPYVEDVNADDLKWGSGAEEAWMNYTLPFQKTNGLYLPVSKDNPQNVRVSKSIVDFAALPVYYGLHPFGTLKYDGTELRRPLRPWRSDQSFSIIATDAGTSSNIQFIASGNRIVITTETFDCRMLDVGDNITISDTSSNNGTFEIATLETGEITTVEALTDEGPGAATIVAAGDIPARAGTNLDGYTFEDTSATPANRLLWHVFGDVIGGEPKIIRICDRVVVAECSWNHVRGETVHDEYDYIFGKKQTINGIDVTVRSLTGGDRDRDGRARFVLVGGSLPNEWDRYIMNGIDQDLGPFFDGAMDPEHDDYLGGAQLNNNEARRRKHNQHWHWINQYTWCQETIFDDASSRCVRGRDNSRRWGLYAASVAGISIGFRPVLVFPS